MERFRFELAGIFGFALLGAVVGGWPGFLLVALLGALFTLYRLTA